LSSLYLTLDYQRIQYAKSKSHATLRREDPNFVAPAALKAQGIEKRPRDGDTTDGRQTKKERTDDDDEEMEIEDDDS
jgi:U2 small nuclear ribonucleoprotein B''